MWVWALAIISTVCDCQQRKRGALSLYFRLVTCPVCAEALLTACQSQRSGLAPFVWRAGPSLCGPQLQPAKTYRLKDPYSLCTHTHTHTSTCQTCTIDLVWINKVICAHKALFESKHRLATEKAPDWLCVIYQS